LCGNTSVEVADFVFEGDGALLKSGNVGSVSILLSSEQLDGVVVFIAEFGPSILEVVSKQYKFEIILLPQVLEKTDKSLNIGSVDISLGE
jgi:hypothetical protein